jgi:predicted site-specific integrase-resolvase
MEEVGGELNFERKKFTALMDAIGRGEVFTLIIAHQDRLTRSEELPKKAQ